MQCFFPDLDIAEGIVWTGESSESHFWNVLTENDVAYHVDLTWQQFPGGSQVTSFHILDRNSVRDSQETVQRCDRLERRVRAYLDGMRLRARPPSAASARHASDHRDVRRRTTAMAISPSTSSSAIISILVTLSAPQ